MNLRGTANGRDCGECLFETASIPQDLSGSDRIVQELHQDRQGAPERQESASVAVYYPALVNVAFRFHGFRPPSGTAHRVQRISSLSPRP